MPGTHLPLVKIPRNVTFDDNPINMAGTRGVDTVSARKLIDLDQGTYGTDQLRKRDSGSTELRARTMLEAIRDILQETDLQVLWKMVKLEPFDDRFLSLRCRSSRALLMNRKTGLELVRLPPAAREDRGFRPPWRRRPLPRCT